MIEELQDYLIRMGVPEETASTIHDASYDEQLPELIADWPNKATVAALCRAWEVEAGEVDWTYEGALKCLQS
jgi:hypothetical protein